MSFGDESYGIGLESDSSRLVGTIGSFTGSMSGAFVPPVNVTGVLASSIGAFTGSVAATFTPAPVTGSLVSSIGTFVGSFNGQSFAPGLSGYLAASVGAFGGGFLGELPDGITETRDLGLGRLRLGTGEDVSLYPVPALPGYLTVEPMRIMAQQLPTPVLVDGKPT